MTNIRDLDIEKEILPLFDFTFNNFAKEKLFQLLGNPLSSIEEILSRQAILKSIILNLKLFKSYSYSKRDLHDTYNFFCNYANIETSKAHFTLRLFVFQKERHQIRSIYSQLIILLHKLQTNYFEFIDINSFPASYRTELQTISDFLFSFNLPYYEKLIRKNKIKVKHIIELSDIVSSKVSGNEHKLFWQSLFLFEAYLSISKGIVKHQFSFPVFSSQEFWFEELYHPLINKPVKNSFTISNNVILLTGANMSGKSTFLKAIGLAIYLGHIGLGVPALRAKMPLFDSISITININDDIKNGFSHFMSEIKNLKEILIQSTNNKKCFAVFDELFRGTNIDDAIEVSTSTVKGLLQFKNSVFVISTHLHQLKSIDEVQTGEVSSHYFDCALIDNTPLFTYHLRKGWSDLKVGQILFEQEGLNKLLSPK